MQLFKVAFNHSSGSASYGSCLDHPSPIWPGHAAGLFPAERLVAPLESCLLVHFVGEATLQANYYSPESWQ